MKKSLRDSTFNAGATDGVCIFTFAKDSATIRASNPFFSMSESIRMYTDGAARGNPGPGGYGVILISGQLRKELSQGYRKTTNNRMELMAVIAGLTALKKTGLDITVYTDSQYVSRAIEEGWLNNWIRTSFKGGKKNKDLWMQYAELAQNHRVKFVWVKGH
ncbi:MAG TPA: ribonuclease H, partial [Chitinophagaceae bacterium]